MADIEYSIVLYNTFMDYDNIDRTDKLDEGYSRKWVLAQFVNSREFTVICNKYGIERGLLATGSNDLPGGAPEIVDNPYEGIDPVKAFVFRMYTVALGRSSASESEVNDYANKLKNHEITGADMAYFFCMGAEFENRGLSNDDFSKTMYRSFMGRERADGEAGWVDALDSGYNRKWIMAQFVNSTEYTNICRSYGIDRGTLAVPDSEKMAR